jgi:V/A-type H+-transporting ATPase subunit E
MQNKLQELTEKIYKEGLSKGTEEAAQLVAKAKEDASKIVADAKKQAEQIVAQARKEGEDFKKNVETEVGISTKQVISGLKQSISRLLEAEVVQTPLVNALKDVDFIKKIIETAISRWDPTSPEKVTLFVLVPEGTENELKEHFTGKVLATLNNEFEIVADKILKYGFKIGPKDGSYLISFTEKDFENLFREYMRPRIVEMLFGGK